MTHSSSTSVPPLVVCGESLLDVFQDRATPGGLLLDAVVGGSPLNVAIGLTRLGVPTWFLGGLSSDFLGERIRAHMAQEGLGLEALALGDAPTTLSLIGVDAAGVPSYRFYGHGGADRQLRPEHLRCLPSRIAALHVGSYACVVEPIGSTIRELVQARCADTLIAYDPNIRLNVEPDIEVWQAMLGWMSYRAHLIKLSDEDFERLYPGQAPEVLAQRWLQAGVKLVVMTRGGQGAFAWHRSGGVIEVAAPHITVADTVGAGDTVQAAMLTWLHEHDRLTPAGLAGLDAAQVRELLGFAVRAAAITCTRRGPDMPRRDQLIA